MADEDESGDRREERANHVVDEEEPPHAHAGQPTAFAIVADRVQQAAEAGLPQRHHHQRRNRQP